MKNVISVLICLAIALTLAWMLEINPEKEYGWFMGFIHGGFLVPNWIISLFSKGWLCKAPLHTTMYNVDWWIMAILCTTSWVLMILGTIMNLFVNKR